MKKQHLLPHAWQWVGLVALVIGIVCAVYVTLFLAKGDWGQMNYFTSIHELGFLVLTPFSAIILCFTREIIEDERIDELRKKSLVITAIIFVVLLIIGPVKSIILSKLFSYTTINRYNLIWDHSWWMLFVYLLIFKISYWVQNKRYSDEK